MKFLQFLFIFAFAYAVKSARILGVFHMPAFSHNQLGQVLLKALAERGHEVTVITPYEDKKPPRNLKQVILTGLVEELQPMKDKLFEQTESNVIKSIIELEDVGLQLAEKTLSHPNVQAFLKSGQKFDLIILHQFINDAFKGFCHYYNAPCVALSPLSAPFWTHAQTGNPDSPAYIADMYSDPEFDPTSFTSRFTNTVIYTGLRLFYYFYSTPRQNEVLQKYFPNSPSLYELYYNTSLILINSHYSINPAVPLLPNMVEIGGYHVKPPKKLPEDLQTYLDSAKDGVVLFTLGSNLQSKSMSKEKRESILKAFSKLKQRVLWKWEEETLPNQPKNVELRKWLPQSDIMAHPNVKAMITHGGVSGLTESIYHGLPVVVVSVFADQEKNGKAAERAGYGISVPYKELTEEKLSHALHEVLNNPKYRENMKTRSEIMQDEPIKQLDKAIFWTEYVIRHKGAPHLRSAALDLWWYQYLLLDVVAVAVLIVLTPVFVTYRLIKRICCSRSKKTNTNVSKSKKKN